MPEGAGPSVDHYRKPIRKELSLSLLPDQPAGEGRDFLLVSC